MPSLINNTTENEETPTNGEVHTENRENYLLNSTPPNSADVTNGTNAHAQQEPQQVRETTQTDHINKKLLTSFLTHINSTNFANEQVNQQNDDEFE